MLADKSGNVLRGGYYSTSIERVVKRNGYYILGLRPLDESGVHGVVFLDEDFNFVKLISSVEYNPVKPGISTRSLEGNILYLETNVTVSELYANLTLENGYMILYGNSSDGIHRTIEVPCEGNYTAYIYADGELIGVISLSIPPEECPNPSSESQNNSYYTLLAAIAIVIALLAELLLRDPQRARSPPSTSPPSASHRLRLP